MKLEQINYDLQYYGSDEKLRELLVGTIGRLPPDVVEYALDKCVFLSVGRAALGMTLPGRVGVHRYRKRSSGVWIVLLEERTRKRDLPSVIAHEIAHAWLKHNRLGDTPEDCENQAATLTRSWGFTGIGADEHYCSMVKT